VFFTKLRTAHVDADTRLDEVHSSSRDRSVSRYELNSMDVALMRYGYQIEQALGRLKGHPIFKVVAAPQVLATGQFPDDSTFPKIVTAQDLSEPAHQQQVLDNWFGRFLPVLHQARRGLMTTLYKAVFDDNSHHLFLFSEFVDDPRFGTQLDELELDLTEALGLGYLVARQVSRLHDEGIAHNNVQADSLLVKGLGELREVQPAMVGLVEPSVERAAIYEDVRQLATMLRSWLRPCKVDAFEPRLRTQLESWRTLLTTMAYDKVANHTIDRLIATIADGRRQPRRLLSLLLVSHSLYGRLWD